jgi:hypothetical protein
LDHSEQPRKHRSSSSFQTQLRPKKRRALMEIFLETFIHKLPASKNLQLAAMQLDWEKPTATAFHESPHTVRPIHIDWKALSSF